MLLIAGDIRRHTDGSRRRNRYGENLENDWRPSEKRGPPKLETADLTPVAFNPDIASGSVAIVAGDPAGSPTRRRSISSGHPDITLTVPAVVTRLPDPVAVTAGAGRDNFTAWRRRTDADGNLSRSDTCRE